MSKTLDEFMEPREPKGETRVETRVEGRSETIPEGVKVYLATSEAFSKYCEGCGFLLKTEELERGLWQRRVFCKAEKCVK